MVDALQDDSIRQDMTIHDLLALAIERRSARVTFPFNIYFDGDVPVPDGTPSAAIIVVLDDLERYAKAIDELEKTLDAETSTQNKTTSIIIKP